MEKWLTKQNVLILSSLGMIVTLIAGFLYRKSMSACSNVQIDALNDSYNTCLLVGSLTLIFVPVFVFSVALIFSKNKEIFISWVKFTSFYLLVYLATVFTRPSQSDFLNPSQEDTSWALSLGYFVLGIFFIAYKAWESSKVNKGSKPSFWLSWLVLVGFLLVGVFVSFLILNV